MEAETAYCTKFAFTDLVNINRDKLDDDDNDDDDLPTQITTSLLTLKIWIRVLNHGKVLCIS